MGRQNGGTDLAKVIRLDGPTRETFAAQRVGRRDRQDSAANPPNEPPKTATRSLSTQSTVPR